MKNKLIIGLKKILICVDGEEVLKIDYGDELTVTDEQKNCKYCHKPFEEIAVLEYDLACIGIGQNNELYGGGTGDDEYGYNEVHAKIFYCPMCGRKLNNE